MGRFELFGTADLSVLAVGGCVTARATSALRYVAAQAVPAVRVCGARARLRTLVRAGVAALPGHAVSLGLAARDALVALAATPARAVAIGAALRPTDTIPRAALCAGAALRVARAFAGATCFRVGIAALPGHAVGVGFAARRTKPALAAATRAAVGVVAARRGNTGSLAALRAGAALGIGLAWAARLALLGRGIAALARQAVRVRLAAWDAFEVRAAASDATVHVPAARGGDARAVAALLPRGALSVVGARARGLGALLRRQIAALPANAVYVALAARDARAIDAAGTRAAVGVVAAGRHGALPAATLAPSSALPIAHTRAGRAAARVRALVATLATDAIRIRAAIAHDALPDGTRATAARARRCIRAASSSGFADVQAAVETKARIRAPPGRLSRTASDCRCRGCHGEDHGGATTTSR